MEKPTQGITEEEIACMESLAMDVEETAQLLREKMADEKLHFALYAIEMAARKLGELVGRLAPPA